MIFAEAQMLRRLCKFWLCAVTLLVLSACAPADSIGEPARFTLTPLPIETFQTAQPSATTEPVGEIALTISPAAMHSATIALPVAVGTPVPSRSDPIFPNSIDEIVELARWEMGFVNALVYSLDGDVLVAGLGDYWEGEPSFGVRVMDADDGTLLLDTGKHANINETMKANIHAGAVVGVDVSPDGNLLASVDEDGQLRLWQLPGGALLAELDHPGYMTGVAFSPDCSTISGCIVAVGVNEPQQWGAVYLWQVHDVDFLASGGDPDLAGTLIEKYGRINSLRYSPDGKMLASGSKGIVRVWRVADGIAILSLEENTAMVSALAFSPDGELLAAGTESGYVFVWQLGKRNSPGFGDLLIEAGKGEDSITDMHFSPEGQHLIVGYYSGLLQVWPISADQADRQHPLEPVFQIDDVGGGITGLAISPAGDLLAVGINDIFQPGGPVMMWGIPIGY